MANPGVISAVLDEHFPIDLTEYLAALKEADDLLHEPSETFNESVARLNSELAETVRADADTFNVMDMLMQDALDLESSDNETKSGVSSVLAFGMIAGLILIKRLKEKEYREYEVRRARRATFCESYLKADDRLFEIAEYPGESSPEYEVAYTGREKALEDLMNELGPEIAYGFREGEDGYHLRHRFAEGYAERLAENFKRAL